jgi:hypothetical protein
MAKAKPKIDVEADTEAPPPTDVQMKQISDMVNNMLQLQQELLEAQAVCSAFVNQIERLSGTDIPEAMKAIGMTMFKMADGRIVDLKEIDIGSYTKENEPAVFKWLRANEHGDLIKSEIGLLLGKGKEHLVTKLQKVLQQKAYEGCVIEIKEGIHASTFKAFVREQLAAGVSLPKQVSIFHKTETIVKELKNGNSKKGSTSSKGNSSGKVGQDLF